MHTYTPLPNTHIPLTRAHTHTHAGLFKGIPLRQGAIERRMMTRRMEEDKDFAKVSNFGSVDATSCYNNPQLPVPAGAK